MTSKSNIPQFYFPKYAFAESKQDGKCQQTQTKNDLLMKQISRVFQEGDYYLTEFEFEAVTNLCSLPRYMNLALFRAVDELNSRITFNQFKKSWQMLTQGEDHTNDIDLLIYAILKKPDADTITPNDFLPILEDIVLNHPSLQFLEDNMAFQERYIETVICRIFYKAHCLTGKMTLNAFRKSGFGVTLLTLTPSVDLYNINNVFSYIQFYVLYCKLWSLDTDHDLSLTETDLRYYNMGALSHLTIQRIMDTGHIMVFADPVVISSKKLEEPSTLLTYFDFIWFLLSEVDKSTPVAIEYWFRCLDVDDDGVLSFFELETFWKDQGLRQRFYGSTQNDDYVQFEDIMRQMNDLIQPQIPGQFSLKDLKKNGYLAERFFDTFINFDRFQVHDAHQEGSIRQQLEYENKILLEKGVYRSCEPLALTDELGFPILCNWNDYTDIEYHRIVADECYINSYGDNESYTQSQQEEEYFGIRPSSNENVDFVGFDTRTEAQVEYASSDTISSNSPRDENSRNDNTLTDKSIKTEDHDKIKHDNNEMLKTKRNTLAISLDCSHSRSEDVIEIISQFLSLSNLEDAMDHKSIEGSGTCTPESPVIITPKIHLDQDNQGLSLKHTAATSYFDLDSEDHLPKRRIQHNNSIIDCVN